MNINTNTKLNELEIGDIFHYPESTRELCVVTSKGSNHVSFRRGEKDITVWSDNLAGFEADVNRVDTLASLDGLLEKLTLHNGTWRAMLASADRAKEKAQMVSREIDALLLTIQATS